MTNIRELTQYKSQYTIRLYQLARKLQNIGITEKTKTWKQEKIYTVDEFQKIMGSNYKTWQDINRWVVQPALEELKENSFLYVNIEPIKEYKDGQTRGRKGVKKVKVLTNRVNHYQPKLI